MGHGWVILRWCWCRAIAVLGFRSAGEDIGVLAGKQVGVVWYVVQKGWFISDRCEQGRSWCVRVVNCRGIGPSEEEVVRMR